ncbi:MAG: succinate dehydrogenase cytochrome b subunit [Bdellovibrionales bacterium]
MQNATNKRCWVSASIGRKQLIGLTGIGLSLFVLIHMMGNLLILVGPQVYNEYSYKLISNPLIYVAEAGLVALFLVHLIQAVRISWSNYKARGPVRYAVLPNGSKRTTWTQRSLWAQGLLILVFTILHLITFKYGTHYTVNYGQGEIRDLHRLVIEVFHEPLYVVWYLVALVVLGLHLAHGVKSSFQSLGIHHPRYQRLIRWFGLSYAWIVALGFISQPIYVYLFH